MYVHSTRPLVPWSQSMNKIQRNKFQYLLEWSKYVRDATKCTYVDDYAYALDRS